MDCLLILVTSIKEEKVWGIYLKFRKWLMKWKWRKRFSTSKLKNIDFKTAKVCKRSCSLGMIYLIQISTVVLNLESHPAYWTVSAPYTTALYKKLRVSENIGGNRILHQASRRSYFGVMRMVHCWESWTRHILTQIQRTFGKTTKLMYLGQEGGRAGVGCC